MLTPPYGLDRRGLLRASAAGVVGASLPNGASLAGDSISANPVGFGRAKSVLIVLLSGGPSQLDTLDRPHHLLNGNVISNLYTGASA